MGCDSNCFYSTGKTTTAAAILVWESKTLWTLPASNSGESVESEAVGTRFGIHFPTVFSASEESAATDADFGRSSEALSAPKDHFGIERRRRVSIPPSKRSH